MSEFRNRCINVIGRTDLEVRWCADTNNDGFRQLPFLSRLAWRLRILADRLDGRAMRPDGVRSYTLQGHLPAFITKEQWDDAFCFGIGGMARYFDDLDLERQATAETNDRERG